MKNKPHHYKKLSHFSDMVLKMSDEPNTMNYYTDKQFEEDFNKWLSEKKYKSKTIQNQNIDNFLKDFKSSRV